MLNGKFAGFLKRIKPIVNTGAKFAKLAYNKVMDYGRNATESILNAFHEGLGTAVKDASKPISDINDWGINKTLDWVIKKTNTTTSNPSQPTEKIEAKPVPTQQIPSQPSPNMPPHMPPPRPTRERYYNRV